MRNCYAILTRSRPPGFSQAESNAISLLEPKAGNGKDKESAERSAKIYLYWKIGNNFAVRLVIQSKSDGGWLDFGPYGSRL